MHGMHKSGKRNQNENYYLIFKQTQLSSATNLMKYAIIGKPNCGCNLNWHIFRIRNGCFEIDVTGTSRQKGLLFEDSECSPCPSKCHLLWSPWSMAYGAYKNRNSLNQNGSTCFWAMSFIVSRIVHNWKFQLFPFFFLFHLQTRTQNIHTTHSTLDWNLKHIFHWNFAKMSFQ